MGLFNFLKNAGAKLVNKDERHVNYDKNSAMDKMAAETARKQKEAVLKSLVSALNTDIQDFSLEYDGEVVTVYGTVDSQADKEKIVLRLGNVNGIAGVDDRISVVNPEPEAVFYEVKRGDSLSKIAKQFYGDPMKYKIIFEANQPMLDNPDMIYPGQTLRIPNQ